jgi:hypothetical protein
MTTLGEGMHSQERNLRTLLSDSGKVPQGICLNLPKSGVMPDKITDSW